MKKIAGNTNYRVMKMAENAVFSNNRVTIIRVSLLSMGIKEILGFMGIVGAAFGLGKWGGWVKDKWDSLTSEEKKDAGDQEIVQNLIASLSAEELKALYYEILAHREIEEFASGENIAPKVVDSRLESVMREISDKFEAEIIKNNQEVNLMLDGKKIAADRNYKITKNAIVMVWLGAAYAAFSNMFDGGTKIINSISKDVFDEEANELYKKWYNKLKNTDLISGMGSFPAEHAKGGAFMRSFVHQKWLAKQEMTEEEFEDAFESYYGESAKGLTQFGLDNEEGWVESFNLLVKIKKGQDAAKAAGKDWRQERPSFEKKKAEARNFEMKKIASDRNYEIVNGNNEY